MSSSDETTYCGQCFCGAVKIEATGQPFAMGYCHCDDCRSWAAAPVTSFTLWSPDAVTVTAGADKLTGYKKTQHLDRQSCSVCGGNVMSVNRAHGFTDIYASVIPELAFEPAMHVFYGESVLAIRDGLPKFKDLPEQAGGSGEMCAE